MRKGGSEDKVQEGRVMKVQALEQSELDAGNEIGIRTGSSRTRTGARTTAATTTRARPLRTARTTRTIGRTARTGTSWVKQNHLGDH